MVVDYVSEVRERLLKSSIASATEERKLSVVQSGEKN